MTVLYVTEQGATIGVGNERLHVRKGRAEMASPRLDDLTQVVVYGYVQVTSQALRKLMARGIDTVFLTYGGKFVGRLAGPMGKNIELRQAQFGLLTQEEERLRLAKIYVSGKISNSRTLLRRYQRRRQDELIAKALVMTRIMAAKVDQARTLDEVRGIEGQAASAYFSAFPALIQADGIQFTGRKRRPPPDPVNILLSFGYTLLLNQVQGACEQAGLDPYLGALHGVKRGMPSLALDLMEEFRPVIVDVAVLRALNTGAITKRDFVPTTDEYTEGEDEYGLAPGEDPEDDDERASRRPMQFTKDGVKRWFNQFERRLSERAMVGGSSKTHTYRQIIREQVYALCRHLQGKEEYRPFQMSR